MPTVACPDADTLEHFLLGEIEGPTADELDAHVAGCAACGDHLSRLRGDDDLVGLMRRSSTVLTSVDPSHVESLMMRLRASGAVASPTPDLLDPPTAAGELGRLGPYRVVRELGRGGMGIVYAAEDPRLGRPVALKVIRDVRVDDPHWQARFEQE